LLENKINDVCIKTLITLEPHVYNSVVGLNNQRNCCFELFGFDILIDKNFNANLIEENILPSLSSSSMLDKN